jgi:hypothetical protein
MLYLTNRIKKTITSLQKTIFPFLFIVKVKVKARRGVVAQILFTPGRIRWNKPVHVSLCFGRHVKLLVPAAFAVLSTHSSFKEG